jgi:hypothetical protein
MLWYCEKSRFAANFAMLVRAEFWSNQSAIEGDGLKRAKLLPVDAIGAECRW